MDLEKNLPFFESADFINKYKYGKRFYYKNGPSISIKKNIIGGLPFSNGNDFFMAVIFSYSVREFSLPEKIFLTNLIKFKMDHSRGKSFFFDYVKNKKSFLEKLDPEKIEILFETELKDSTRFFIKLHSLNFTIFKSSENRFFFMGNFFPKNADLARAVVFSIDIPEKKISPILSLVKSLSESIDRETEYSFLEKYFNSVTAKEIFYRIEKRDIFTGDFFYHSFNKYGKLTRYRFWQPAGEEKIEEEFSPGQPPVLNWTDTENFCFPISFRNIVFLLICIREKLRKNMDYTDISTNDWLNIIKILYLVI